MWPQTPPSATDLRQKLKSPAGPGKTANETANEIIAQNVREQEKDRDWRDLLRFARKNGEKFVYPEADAPQLIPQIRKP